MIVFSSNFQQLLATET